MTKKLVALHVLATLILLPLNSFAVNFIGEPGGGALDIKAFINKTVDVFWWVFVAGVVILFLIAGLTFLTAKGDTTKLDKAKLFAIWGIVGVFVGVVGFSITEMIKNFFKL